MKKSDVEDCVVISSMLAEEFLALPGDLKSNEANLVLQRVPTIFGKKEANVFFFHLTVNFIWMYFTVL
jgi:hypothetical protein